MTRHPWQLPDGGLSEGDLTTFWRSIERGPGDHWMWHGGSNGNYPAMRVNGRLVLASRIAWGVGVGNPIPGVLRTCTQHGNKCVNPMHSGSYKGQAVTSTKAPDTAVTVTKDVTSTSTCVDCQTPITESQDWSNEPGIHRCEKCEKIRLGLLPKPPAWDVERNEAQRISVGANSAKPATADDILSSFRTLDALAHMQFGKEPAARHTATRVATTEVIRPAEGTVTVKVPVGTVKTDPSPAARDRFQPVSTEELLAVLFAPNTMCVTFPSGSVLISGPDGRVMGPDAEAAVQEMLYVSGKRRVVG
jgi:hypothetical protein